MSDDVTLVTRRRYFPAVEGMRAVAALAVVVGHVVFYSLGQSAGGDVAFLGYWLGQLGVAIFFAISGFLLYRPFIAARGSRSVGSTTPSFFWRRAVRIFPAYWVALTVLAIWPGLTAVFSSHWWVYYGLLQIYSPTWAAGGIGPAWSLCVEVSFYLALPLVALLLARIGVNSGNRFGGFWEVGVLGGLAAASIYFVSRVAIDGELLYLVVTLPATFVWFVGGMLLAGLQVLHPARLSWLRWPLRQPWLCWPLGAGLIAVIEFNLQTEVLHLELQEYQAVTPLLLGIAATLLAAPAMVGDSGRIVSVTLGNRVMTFLGTVSYGIYLWHYPLLLWLLGTTFVATSFSPLVVSGAIMVPAAIALGAASWYLVEKPLMRRARSVKAFKHSGHEAIAPPSRAPDRAGALGGAEATGAAVRSGP